MVDTSAFRKRLQDRLDELEARLTGIEHDLDEPGDPNFEDRATEREGDEVLESLGQSGLSEIKQIQAALVRIEEGTFGICVACGEDISDERLETIPHAARCRHCA